MIEDAIISYILNEAKNQGVEKIRADFIPTKKNNPAEAFLPNCGFKKENEYCIEFGHSTVSLLMLVTLLINNR